MHRTIAMGFIVLLLSGNVQAALVTGGITSFGVNPIQDITLFAGGPLGLPADAVFSEANGNPISAVGTVSFTRLAQTQVGTIELIDGTFTGTGTIPGFGAFELLGGNSGFDPITATLSNVVQDSNHPGFASGSPDSIISADIVINVPNYGARLLDQGNAVLEVRTGFVFEASLDGLPASVGTRFEANPFAGAASELDIFLRGDPTNTVVGFSTRRFMVAVPEPTSLGILTAGIFLICRRRTRA